MPAASIDSRYARRFDVLAARREKNGTKTTAAAIATVRRMRDVSQLWRPTTACT